ncbi:hemolysin-III related domain-containing protein [Pochonia chlamydosporia 170]|uniref:Hemolysin-III related domain-containing protein n=1 Tax=Pochonia chlamydosporia 170 TaxID=1380566 RepID=A0A179EYH3_METCM|nr:hemolysin-III related domain-containing protein [Pochonia chlamydosporia 170]OAQ57883.1 hemolysin-III related domain-containing protein [Pochonia chlamydosporia 170]
MAILRTITETGQNLKGEPHVGRRFSEWQLNNKYILSGYCYRSRTIWRPSPACWFCTTRLAMCIPVWPRISPPPTICRNCFFQYLSEPQFLNVSSLNYAMFGIRAEICLVLRTLYHLIHSRSHRMQQFWRRMDLLDILM